MNKQSLMAKSCKERVYTGASPYTYIHTDRHIHTPSLSRKGLRCAETNLPCPGAAGVGAAAGS